MKKVILLILIQFQIKCVVKCHFSLIFIKKYLSKIIIFQPLLPDYTKMLGEHIKTLLFIYILIKVKTRNVEINWLCYCLDFWIEMSIGIQSFRNEGENIDRKPILRKLEQKYPSKIFTSRNQSLNIPKYIILNKITHRASLLVTYLVKSCYYQWLI